MGAARAPLHVLVLGAYGHFGSRISRALARDSGIALVLAGRDAVRAAALAETLAGTGPHAPRAVALDHRDPDFAERLRALGAGLVIHTAGPFQGQDYAVARQCIRAGVHYADLADGRDFVAGIGALDREARAADVLVAGGASTLPAISALVVDSFAPSFSAIDSIETSIAPAQRTPRGQATLAGVLSYCGRPVQGWEDGRVRPVYGWQDLRRHHYPGLGRRWLSACDVPDLALFPQRYPGVRTVRFHAALELGVLSWGLWGAAWLARAGIVRDWARWAGALKAAGDAFDVFGGDRGGMEVAVAGIGRDGRPLRRTWSLLAEEGHGPEIPCLPAIILARRLAAGTLAARGAQPCMGLFGFDDLAAAAAPWRIRWEAADEAA